MPVAQTRLETLQICKLLQCVREDDKTQIEKLTINGVPHLINFNEPGEGDTALIIAAVANNDGLITFLLDLGAHPDVVDFKGRTPAMRAAEYGHIQCLERLAKAGANMQIKDLEGNNILMYCIASTQRHQKCTEVVLAFGADVNSVDKLGCPILVKACETANENEDSCLMLLQKGVDPNSKHQKSNRTALMAAAGSGSAKVVKAILEKGADPNQLMNRTKTHAAHEAAKGGFLEVLFSLAGYGANFDQTDDQGNTPIHLAAHHGHGLCIRYLSQRGCNPKPKNSEGLTAKVIGKDQGHKDCMKEARKAEKSFGRVGKNNEPWALALYDFACQKEAQLLEMFQKFDDGAGTVSKDDFVDGLQNMGAPMPEENDMKKIITAHDKNRDGMIDYNDFLQGKKYINKLYLVSAFEGKKKKKKGGKGKKKKVPTATLR